MAEQTTTGREPRRRGWARRSTRRLLGSSEEAKAVPSTEAGAEAHDHDQDTLLEQRLLRTLREAAEALDVSPGDLVEGIVRRALEKGSAIGRELGPDSPTLEPQQG